LRSLSSTADRLALCDNVITSKANPDTQDSTMPNQPANWSAFLTNWIAGTFSEEQTTNLDLQSLEDRVLYSAGPVPVDFAQAEVVETGLDSIELAESIDDQFNFVADAIESYDATGFEDAPSVTSDLDLGAQNPIELVIVDTSVEGYQQLVDDILSSKSGRNVELAYIESGSDGIKQITNAVTQRTNISAIHLVTHGDDGQLSIGDTLLTQESLAQFGDEIAGWSTSLTHDADFLIYGCNVAQSDSGEAFVNELADLLDADISASNDITGHESLQGDWEFEYQVGQIDSDVVFSAEILTAWNYSLESVDASSNDGSAGSIAVSESGQVTAVSTSSEVVGAVGEDVYYTRSELGANEFSPEIRINTTVEGNQNEVSVASAANGNTVFVWTSDHSVQNEAEPDDVGTSQSTAEPAHGVFARVIDSNGNEIVGEFQVDTGGDARNASVAVDDAGNFVVAWETSIGSDQGDVYVSYYDFLGNLVDTELVNSDTTGNEGSPDVSLNNNGEFVVAWDNFASTDVAAQTFVQKFQFDPATNQIVSVGENIAVANELEFTNGNSNFQIHANPDVDISERGEFVVAFTQSTVGDFATGIAARSFFSDGTEAAAFDVTANSSFDSNEFPSVALIEDQFTDTLTPNDNQVLFVYQSQDLNSDATTGPQVEFGLYTFDGTVLGVQNLGSGENVAVATYGNDKFAYVGYQSEPDGSGLEFNVSNDVIFEPEDGALDEFTIEVTLTSDQVGNTSLVPLINYGDLLIQYDPAQGTLLVDLPGGSGELSDIPSGQTPDYNGLLFDGRQHTLAFSFQNSGDGIDSNQNDQDNTPDANRWSIFVDGQLVQQGSTDVFASSTLPGGERLVVGQSSPEGNLDPNVFFDGTIHDVQVWNLAFNGAAAETNLRLQYAQDNIPTGLIANWQFNELAGGQEVVNVIDPANSLELQSTGIAGAIAGNANDRISVIENANSDTVVATFDVTSQNNQEVYTYSLVDDGSGRFEIDPITGELSVLNGNFIDFELNPTITVAVEATNSQGDTISEVFEIDVLDDVADNPDNPLNLPPQLEANFAPTFQIRGQDGEPAVSLIENTVLQYTDPENFSFGAPNITYTVDSPPEFGILLLDGEPLGDRSFTQQDIDDFRVSYRYTGPLSTTAETDGFSFTVTDSIDPISDSFSIFLGNTLNEGESRQIGQDPNQPDQIRFPGLGLGEEFMLLSPPTNGQLLLDGFPLPANSFTLEQLIKAALPTSTTEPKPQMTSLGCRSRLAAMWFPKKKLT